MSFHARRPQEDDLQCPPDGPRLLRWNAWHGNNDTIKLYCCPPARMLYQQTACLSVHRSIYLSCAGMTMEFISSRRRSRGTNANTDYLYRMYIEGCPTHAFSPVSPLIWSSITLCYGSRGRRTRSARVSMCHISWHCHTSAVPFVRIILQFVFGSEQL